MVDDYCLQPTAIDQAFYKPSNNQLFYPSISGNNLSTIAQTNSMYSQDIASWNSNPPLVDYRLFSSNNMRYGQRNNGNLSPSLLYNPLVNVSNNHLGCLTESPFTNLYGKHSSLNQYNLFHSTPNSSGSNLSFPSTRNSLRFTFEENSEKPKKPHIKKPLNAFMLFMKEMRAKVVAECTLKESAAINQILGRRWHALSREEQAKYYEMARKEKELHHQLYPGWSARDNYATQIKRQKKRQGLSMCNTSKIIKDLSKRDKGAPNNAGNQSWVKNSPLNNLPTQTSQLANDAAFQPKPHLISEPSKLHQNSNNYVSSMMSPFSCSSFPIFSPPSHVQLSADLESYNLSYGSPAFQNSFGPPTVNYPNQLPPIFDQTICQAIRLEQSAGRSN